MSSRGRASLVQIANIDRAEKAAGYIEYGMRDGCHNCMFVNVNRKAMHMRCTIAKPQFIVRVMSICNFHMPKTPDAQ